MLLARLLNDAKCHEVVRQVRWPEEVKCPHCGADRVSKQGRDARPPERQGYRWLLAAAALALGGVSQDKLPLWIGFFEFMRNARRRGAAPLESVLEALLAPTD